MNYELTKEKKNKSILIWDLSNPKILFHTFYFLVHSLFVKNCNISETPTRHLGQLGNSTETAKALGEAVWSNFLLPGSQHPVAKLIPYIMPRSA